MTNESGKTWNLTSKLLAAMLAVIISLTGVIYADMRSEFKDMSDDIEAIVEDVDTIKQKVSKRDTFDEFMLRDLNDLKDEFKALKERVRVVEGR